MKKKQFAAWMTAAALVTGNLGRHYGSLCGGRGAFIMRIPLP